MLKTLLNGKIHRATVTDANLNYVGSVTIDTNLLDAAGIDIHEKVQIVNNNNGARLETYAIAGKAGSGEICLNGAAARLVQPGDTVIIMSFVLLDKNEVANHKPKVVLVDEHNKITQVIDGETAGVIG